MDIFESLENLNVSEECFQDIVGLVEMYLSEGRNLSNALSRGIVNYVSDEDKKDPEVQDYLSYLGRKASSTPDSTHKDDTLKNKPSAYDELANNGENPEKRHEGWNKSSNKQEVSHGITKHYKKLAKDILSKHLKGKGSFNKNYKDIKVPGENIDGIRANLDMERSKRASEIAKGEGRYRDSKNSSMSYLSDWYKERAKEFRGNSKRRNERHTNKGLPWKRTERGGDRSEFNDQEMTKDKVLHSIAKHLKKKNRQGLSESLIERIESIVEGLLDKAYKKARQEGQRTYSHLGDKTDISKAQKLADKAFDAQYGTGKYKRDIPLAKPSKNTKGSEATDARRLKTTGEAGQKSEQNAIAASKVRKSNGNNKGYHNGEYIGYPYADELETTTLPDYYVRDLG